MIRRTLWMPVFVLLLSGAYAVEQGWTRFRGPDGTGISDATTIPVEWTDQDYNWKVKLPGVGHCSPVLWGNRIFLTCGDPDTARRTVLCLDTADGHTLWRRDYPSKTFKQHRANSYATATPAADADGVVVTWSTPEEVVLLALDRKTGQTRWQVERRTALSPYSTPCVRRPDDGPPELIFSSTAHGITAVDLVSGKVNWDIDDVFRDRCVGSPVSAAGLVIAGYGHGNRGTRCVVVRPGSRSRNLEPALLYDVTRSVPLVPMPLVKDGRLFLWADDGVVTCLAASTGQVIWRERVGGTFYGSPVCVGGRLYCIARNGEVVVLAASEQFEVLCRVPLGEPSYATPAVSDGVMYLRTFSHLFSLGRKKP